MDKYESLNLQENSYGGGSHNFVRLTRIPQQISEKIPLVFLPEWVGCRERNHFEIFQNTLFFLIGPALKRNQLTKAQAACVLTEPS